MNNALMFSSASDEWSTPQDFYDRLDEEFDFSLDVAASAENKKCAAYFGIDHALERYRDGLVADWRDRLIGMQHFPNGACWMNPPYSRGLQGKFIEKAAQERLRGVLTVALLPARTDTKAFHAHIWDAETHQPREGVEVRFIKGRLKFGGCKASAPFPSMVVVFRPVPRVSPGRSWELLDD